MEDNITYIPYYKNASIIGMLPNGNVFFNNFGDGIIVIDRSSDPVKNYDAFKEKNPKYGFYIRQIIVFNNYVAINYDTFGHINRVRVFDLEFNLIDTFTHHKINFLVSLNDQAYINTSDGTFRMTIEDNKIVFCDKDLHTHTHTTIQVLPNVYVSIDIEYEKSLLNYEVPDDMKLLNVTNKHAYFVKKQKSSKIVRQKYYVLDLQTGNFEFLSEYFGYLFINYHLDPYLGLRFAD